MNDYYDLPSYFSATRDRARSRRQERARAEIKAMTTHAPSAFEPLAETVEPIPASVSSFKLDPPLRPRDQSARSKSIDALLNRLRSR